jgi:hypothetical protein
MVSKKLEKAFCISDVVKYVTHVIASASRFIPVVYLDSELEVFELANFGADRAQRS